MDASQKPHTHLADETLPLQWGHSYLMCPPDHFGVVYEINPWMHADTGLNKDLAYEQWLNLVANLEKAGATVKRMSPVESLPDLVFTANAGLVDDRRFIVSRFRYPERQPEEQHDAEWFQTQGYEVVELPLEEGTYFEGCGDAFLVGQHLVAGYGFRTDLKAHKTLAETLGVEVISIQLVDPRLYHLDISFCPLDSRHAIIAPDAWSPASLKAIQKVVAEPLLLELDEALSFCANAVVVGNVIIMPNCPPRVGSVGCVWFFVVCVSPVTEFLKAGGGVRCLTLALDAAKHRS